MSVYVGIGVHRKRSQLTVIDARGEVLANRNAPNGVGPIDYVDEQTRVLASSLAKRAPGYVSLGFPDPRRLPYAPSAKATTTHDPGICQHADAQL